MNKFKEIDNILNNHSKLLSMLDSRVLPIKEILIKDISDIKQILEESSRKEKK